jgi:predicted metal-dependent phosphoesterase TrpH
VTDHDSIDGYLDLQKQPLPSFGPQLISGIEWSCFYGGMNVHVVGLHFDVSNPSLLALITEVKAVRLERAQQITLRLQQAGLSIDLNAIKQQCQHSMPARPDFAAYMVKTGQVKDSKTAFKRFLGAGKVGDVKAGFPCISKVIAVTKQAGGVSVLAHPQHYKVTQSKLLRLLTEFAEFGGDAVEVGVVQMHPNLRSRLQKTAKELGLKASCGSDFHRPGLPWSDLGKFPAIDTDMVPVWQGWPEFDVLNTAV